MENRYIVAPGHQFEYPADTMSLQIIVTAGGRSRLTPEQQKQIKIKQVSEGEDCSDMPASSRELFVSRGWVIQTPVEINDDLKEEESE
jgi:hypothetical protein